MPKMSEQTAPQKIDVKISPSKVNDDHNHNKKDVAPERENISEPHINGVALNGHGDVDVIINGEQDRQGSPDVLVLDDADNDEEENEVHSPSGKLAGGDRTPDPSSSRMTSTPQNDNTLEKLPLEATFTAPIIAIQRPNEPAGAIYNLDARSGSYATGTGSDGGTGQTLTASGGERRSISHRRKFSAPLLFEPDSRGEDDLRQKSQSGEGKKMSMPDSEPRRAYPSRQRRPRQRARTYGPGDDDRRNESGDPSLTTESIVASEAEEIVHSFMVSSYQRDWRHEYGEPEEQMDQSVTASSPGFAEETPNILELTHFPGNPLSPGTMVGRRLAEFGDEFQERYESDLEDMVNLLLPHIITSSPLGSMIQEAYDSFRSVAMRIFAQGPITWGRIIALLSFGYRMAVALFRHGVRNFVATVIRLILRFLIGERIAQSSMTIVRWIAERGGWMGALQYRLDSETVAPVLQAVANNWFRIISAAAVVLWVWSAVRGSNR